MIKQYFSYKNISLNEILNHSLSFSNLLSSVKQNKNQRMRKKYRKYVNFTSLNKNITKNLQISQHDNIF